MNIPKEKIIDIRDLRIGNYLLYDWKIVHVTFLSMDIDDEYEESIGFCELGKTTNEKADWNRALCDKLDRIALTAEWLERFGFEFKGFLKVNDYESETQFTLRQNEENYTCSVVTSDYGGFVECHWRVRVDGDILYMRTKLEFVHQLQNLFYLLTGEELAIKELV